MKQLIQLTEKGLIPDFLIRLGIQRLLRERLSELSTENCENRLLLQNRFLQALGQSDIAELPEKANEQHYEVPSDFFLQVSSVIGDCRKKCFRICSHYFQGCFGFLKKMSPY